MRHQRTLTALTLALALVLSCCASSGQSTWSPDHVSLPWLTTTPVATPTATPAHYTPTAYTTEASSSFMVQKGYKRKFTGGTLPCYFTSEDDARNSEKINEYTLLLDFAKTRLSLDMSFTALNFTDEYVDSYSTDTVFLTLPYDHNYIRGTFFCALSDYSLPYWLCAGLELLALQEAGYPGIDYPPLTDDELPQALAALTDADMPPFCDAWFSPMLAPVVPDQNAQRLAVTFAKAVLDEFSFPTLLRDFEDDKTCESEIELLNHFTNQSLPLYYIDVNSPLDLHLYDDYAMYICEPGLRWPWQGLQLRRTYCEASCAFAERSLKLTIDNYFYFRLNHSAPEGNSLQTGYNVTDDYGVTTLYQVLDRFVSTAPHDAALALLLESTGVKPGSRLLAEGIATAVEFAFAQEYETLLYESAEERLAMHQNNATGRPTLEVTTFDYYLADCQKRGVNPSPVDLAALVHAKAAAEYTCNGMIDPLPAMQRSIDQSNSYNFDNDLYSYNKAGSLAIYLMKRFGLDKALALLADNHNVEKVLDISWTQLIADWKKSLPTA